MLKPNPAENILSTVLVSFCLLTYCFHYLFQEHTSVTRLEYESQLDTSNLSKAHKTRDSLAVAVRRLSWSISIHFVAIYS